MGGAKRRKELGRLLPRQGQAGVQAQGVPAVASSPFCSRCWWWQVLLRLKWFEAIWALGGGDPDSSARAAAAVLLLLWFPTGHPLASPLGLSITSLLLSQESQQSNLLPGLVFKAKGFLPVRTRDHSSEVPAFPLSYQKTLTRKELVGADGGGGLLPIETPVKDWSQDLGGKHRAPLPWKGWGACLRSSSNTTD